MDVLRGLAILFVVLNHVHMRLVIAHIPYVAATSKPLIASLVWNGQFGVQIFFAVSGFLITSTALRRWGTPSNVRLRDFYLLRVARIAPMLLVLLALMTVLHCANVSPFVVSEKTGGIRRALLAALTLHVNLLQAQRGWLPANWGVLSGRCPLKKCFTSFSHWWRGFLAGATFFRRFFFVSSRWGRSRAQYLHVEMKYGRSSRIWAVWMQSLSVV